MSKAQKWIRVSSAFFLCFLVRLTPFRTPNVEPILATQMPFAKKYGATVGFLFGFISILLYDITTARVGIWTLITGIAYGSLGLFSALYFKNKEASRKNFVIAAIVGTIAYDALTGLTIGPIFFHQSFMVSLIGQVPFTALHLLGNIIFSAILSPAIYRWLTYDGATKSAIVFKKSISAPLIS